MIPPPFARHLTPCPPHRVPALLARLRLLIIYLLDGTVSGDERAKCEDVLRDQGCSLAALDYISTLLEMQRAHTQPSTVQPSHT